MLTFALFMSARMGVYQETVYAKYGKHPSEALFYNVSNSPLVCFCANLSNILLLVCVINCNLLRNFT